MTFQFQRATKRQAKARIGIAGPAGSGKTYTALLLATSMCNRVAVIDTEHGSASKYADEFEFDVLELDDFHPQNYVKAIEAAEAAGYDGLVIDSISHEWNGKNGCLELVELYAKRSKGGNKYAAWADVTPLHNAFIEAIHSAKLHIFATMRSKMDYIQTEDKGRTVIQKVGMAPITREGVEYEMDIVGEMDLEHNMVITKSRCKALADKMFRPPGKELADAIKAWLSDGAPVMEEEKQTTTQEAPVATDHEERLKRLFAIAKEQARAAGHPDPTLHARERWFAVTNTKTMEDVTTDALDRFEADLNAPELQMAEGQ
ncbi:MAG: ATP-binding protein [Firmicutes bacterium]|nr:ATP-binding protein [Bacillota bacterium]